MEIEIINLSSDRERNAHYGLSRAIEAAKRMRCNITFLVGAKRQYPSTLAQYFLTEYEAALLKSKERVVLQNGVSVVLESGYTIQRAGITPLLFVVYGHGDIIPKIKRAIGVKKLIVLTPNVGEARKWHQEFSHLDEFKK